MIIEKRAKRVLKLKQELLLAFHVQGAEKLEQLTGLDKETQYSHPYANQKVGNADTNNRFMPEIEPSPEKATHYAGKCKGGGDIQMEGAKNQGGEQDGHNPAIFSGHDALQGSLHHSTSQKFLERRHQNVKGKAPFKVGKTDNVTVGRKIRGYQHYLEEGAADYGYHRSNQGFPHRFQPISGCKSKIGQW